MNPAEEYIFNQPEPYCRMLMYLKSVIENVVPEAELKYKYKIPFYYLEGKPFCYLNQSKDYVDVGFWKAAYLTLHPDHMTTAGRKVMKSLRYKSLGEINEEIFKDVLQDAYSVKDKKFWG